MALFIQFLRDDNGQDLIEYALLTAAIALAGLATFETIRTVMGVTYASWGTAVNNLWEAPGPQ
jgi:Flp pilus assembly pilin Flp